MAFLLLQKYAVVALSDEMNMNAGAVTRNAMSGGGDTMWVMGDIACLKLLINSIAAL